MTLFISRAAGGDDAPPSPSLFPRLIGLVGGAVVILASILIAGGSYYWVGWPLAVRVGLPVLLIPLLWWMWFKRGARKPHWRGVSLLLIATFLVAYFGKSPPEQDWVPLHERPPTVSFDGDIVTIQNFRDAIHYRDGRPPDVRWTTKSFDLSELNGAEVILQPFGNSKMTVHVLLSFRFEDGEHLAASIESRRTSWDHFKAIGGFFRYYENYVVLGTERDLFEKRLAKQPPETLYIYEVERPVGEIRDYLENFLQYANESAEQPRYFSTLFGSCYSTLIELSPRIQSHVGWYDPRRWISGDAVSLLQGLGIIDTSVSPETLKEQRRVTGEIPPPSTFPSDAAWSRHLRETGLE